MKLLTDATKSVSGWKGIEYRAAFPRDNPPGANFYPPDMDKMVRLCLVTFLLPSAQSIQYKFHMQ